MEYFADHCLCFCPFSFHHCVVCFSLITSLVSPNFSWIQTPNKLNLSFIVDILIANGVDMPEEEFYDLMTKYDLKENGTFSYVEFLRHFILSLKPKEESNLMTRRRLPPTRASVRIE
jgi:hypothetical protein